MSLVPYPQLANQLVTYGQLTPSGRYIAGGIRAAKISKMAYDSGVPQSAARKIGRAFRAYRSRKPKRKREVNTPVAGKPVGAATTKRNDQSMESMSLATRTLYAINLLPISKNSTTNDIDLRNRDVVNFRGVKLCIELKNNDVNNLLYYNIALVTPREMDETAPNIGAVVKEADLMGIYLDGFFRGGGATRGTDFDHLQLSSNEFHCLPINSDKFKVHWHKRLKLGKLQNQTQFESQINIDEYIKVDRQIAYESGSSRPLPSNRMYCVFWCDRFQQNTGSTPVLAHATTSVHLVKYFKDTV